MTYTANQVLRIKAEARETQRLIARELGYREDLQKVAYLASLRTHAAKLELMLEAR